MHVDTGCDAINLQMHQRVIKFIENVLTLSAAQEIARRVQYCMQTGQSGLEIFSDRAVQTLTHGQLVGISCPSIV